MKVRIRAALPSLFAALRIAAPAAILGAIIGEYLGGESGLGVAMIASQTSYEVSRTWGLAIVAGLLAGIAYGAHRAGRARAHPVGTEERTMTATDSLLVLEPEKVSAPDSSRCRTATSGGASRRPCSSVCSRWCCPSR